MNTYSLALILAAGVNSCIGNMLLKWSRMSLPPDAGVVQQYLSLTFVGGLTFYGINVLLFAKALDNMQVSAAYPILAGSGFAFLALASYFMLGESFPPSKLAGLSFVLVGIYLLARTAPA